MNKRFVIVDDDPVSNKICDFTIRKVIEGAEVFCFQYPLAGLNFIKQNYQAGTIHPTILFLDINMPEMNGWAFLEELSQLPEAVCRQFTIYIVSTSIDHADRERAAANKLVKDYLQKPLSSTLMRQMFLSG